MPAASRPQPSACLHPQLKVDVHVTMRAVDLVTEGYELAIRYGDLNDSSLKARKVYELPHVVCGSPRYFARHGRPQTIDELRQHNCIVATFDPCATFSGGGRLIEIFEAFRSDPLPVWMVYHNARYGPAKVRLFIDYFCDNIGPLSEQGCGDCPCGRY
jgi:DNA-binding transcriptional LysR family regulator